MAAKDRLTALQNEITGCYLVAFVDLETSMVLGWAADRQPAQEKLDELAHTTKYVFEGVDAKEITTTLRLESSFVRAIMIDTVEINILLRSPEQMNEVLCFVAHRTAPLQLIIDAGTQFLATTETDPHVV